jgi:hypothetical protein
VTSVKTFDVVIQFADDADFGAIESRINANFPNDPPISKQTIASWSARNRCGCTHEILGCVRIDPEYHRA